MFASKKILTVALTALTIGVGSLAATGSAQAGGWHHHHRGMGWGLGGLATGLVVGSMIASRPVVYAEPAVSCYRAARVNRFGEVIGTRRVCNVVE